MQNRPSALELLQAVRDLLAHDLAPALGDARLRYQALIAAHAIGIAERELPGEWGRLAAELEALTGLLDRPAVAPPADLGLLRALAREANRELCRRIRAGLADDGPWRAAVLRHAEATVEETLAIDNPRERRAVGGRSEPIEHDWGRRLSDALRDALDAGDLARARRLALEGDGLARSLATEYALMHRGLGITVRILLGLLGETVGRATPDPGPAAEQVAALVRRFHTDLRTLHGLPVDAAGAGGAAERPAAGAGPAGLEAEIRRAGQVLEAGQERFTAEQSRLAGDVVLALEAGDAGRARALLDAKEGGHYVPVHDRLVRFMAETFGWVFRRFGPEELVRFHRATALAQYPGFEKWERMTAAAFARATAFLVRQHMGRVTVREDAEKFTLEQAPCGSGGRLRLAGAYEGPEALPVVEGPGPLTLGEPRLPVYCTHCPIWNGLAPLEWFGRPHWVFERPCRPDGGCTVHLYKRRDGAPRDYAARLGMGPREGTP